MNTDRVIEVLTDIYELQKGRISELEMLLNRPQRDWRTEIEQLEGVHGEEIRLLNEHLEKAHEARQKAERAILAMREDYELGWLVNAMPPGYELKAPTSTSKWWYADDATGCYPEATAAEALKAAGVKPE